MFALEELRRLSDARFLSIYEALAEQGFGPLDGEVAKLLRFRPQSIRKLPFETRAKKGRQWLESQKSPELAYELLGSYLVRTKKEIVTEFLDATGVPHEEGMIEDVEVSRPDGAKIGEALSALDAKHDPEDVTTYLAICLEMWPDGQELEAAWRARSGVAPVN